MTVVGLVFSHAYMYAGT